MAQFGAQGMARPRIGEEKDRPVHLGVRVSRWVRAGLDKVAKEDDALVSDVVHDVLVAYLKRRGIRGPQ
jgi:hypothetical protein